jgi:hypothetical protein
MKKYIALQGPSRDLFINTSKFSCEFTELWIVQLLKALCPITFIHVQ